MLHFRDLGYEPDDISVQVSQLLVATADSSDEYIDASVPEVLKLVRERMKLDVAFVSEFTANERILRYVDTASDCAVMAVGDTTPLEEAWCKHVVDGRLPPYIPDVSQDPVSQPLEADLPVRVGTFICAPIKLEGGAIYGTLCSFSQKPQENADPVDLKRMQYIAQLIGEKIKNRREKQA